MRSLGGALLALCLAHCDVAAEERTIERETKSLLDGISSIEQTYVRERVRLQGEFPTLSANSHELWKTGQVGRLVRNGRDFTYALDQVVGDKEALIYGSNIWVSGIDTADLVDDSTISVKSLVFVVVGTKTYRTALGTSRTVKHVETVDTRKADPVVNRLLELSEYRTWTDTTGKFEVVAKLVDFKNGDVQLEKYSEDSTTIEIPMQRLSKDDQKWIQIEMRRRAEEKRKEREAQKRSTR